MNKINFDKSYATRNFVTIPLYRLKYRVVHVYCSPTINCVHTVSNVIEIYIIKHILTVGFKTPD